MRSEIVGEKVILRKYETAHAPLLFEAAIESSGGEFSRWMPWCHENYALEEAASFIAGSIENWSSRAEYDYAIFDVQSGKFLGGVALNLFNHHRKLANLGYWVRTGSQKRGVAHAATRLLAQTAFEDSDLNRIEIAAAVENYASQKTAEKAGATREGVLRQLLHIGGRIHDAALFSFVRADFKN